MNSNIYFVSLGCPKNLVDSQVMLGLLKNENFQIVDKPENAQVIVVNTCSFIESAKQESIDTILEMASYKDSAQCKTLVMAGCLAQRYSKDLQKEIPEVDFFIGTGEYHRIAELVKESQNTRRICRSIHRMCRRQSGTQIRQNTKLPERIYINKPAFIHTEAHPRLQTGDFFSAYLKISEGCNRCCSFCIIPKLRGHTRSRTVESLVEETKSLAQKGVKELNIVAQDLTEYGMEYRYQDMTLEKLLPALCKVDGIEWIRLFYAYPDQFSNELIEIMASEPKIVKYLDMPIQHTNDRILKLMNRKFTRAQIFTFVEKLRKKMPNIFLRTSTIAGFPTETKSEHEDFLEDLKTLKFNHVGVFTYSKEEGTKAAEIANKEGMVPLQTRLSRQRQIQKIHKANSLDQNRKLLNQTLTVLVEGPHPDTPLLLKGRHYGQAPEIDGQVLINDGNAPIGSFVNVRISETMPYDVVGCII